ncbi:sodium-independent anion transporter [Planctomycetales bacterium]|nr:sodium-independent anion transporter [Planctomycetales bacterium]
MFQPKLFSVLRHHYTRKMFFTDAMAGVIVGIVAIPLAIAFGIASGVGPTEGLVTAIIAGFIVSLLGGSNVQIGGPTGAFIVIVYGIIQQHGLSGLILATMMAGVMLVLMGAFKLGNIIKFVPYPVIVGFTGGIALTIFSTQINDLFGLGLTEVPGHFIEKWLYYFEHIKQVNWWALGVSVAGLSVIAVSPKISGKIPGALVAILLLTPAVLLLKEYGGVDAIQTIGDLYALPQGLPAFRLPDFSLPAGMTFFAYLQSLFAPAFTIAMLGAIESLLSAMVADGATGDKHDSNAELVAQGVANVVTPFFGGIPATGAIARTMTNINNGGRSPVAGLVHAVFLLLMMVTLGYLVGYIPMPCLAAVLVVVAYNMSGWHTFVSMRKYPKSDFAVLLVTFFLTVIFDLTVAIEVGMLLAIVLFLKRTNETTEIRSFHDEIIPNEDVTSGAFAEGKLVIPDKVEVYEIDGPYFFGIANKFDDIMKSTGARPCLVRVIRMRKVAFIDSTGLHNLELLCQKAERDRLRIVLSGVKPKVRYALRKAGLIKMLGEPNVCPHIDLALRRAAEVVRELSA